MRQYFLTLQKVSLYSFIKFVLSLKQILTNNINFVIIVLIAFAKLFTCISNLFLKLLKILISNINFSFLIISLFKIFCKVFVFILF